MQHRLLNTLQLQFDFAAPTPVRVFSPEAFLRALRERRARRVKQVRFKDNRTGIIALSRDGSTLHIHSCFRESTDDVLDAVGVFLKAGRRTTAYRDAIRKLRSFWTEKGQSGGWAVAEDQEVIEGVRRLPSSGTPAQEAFLRAAYARYNSLHFGARLPQNFPLRISDRMHSRFGHMRYHTTASGERIVLEIAINHALFLPGHEAALLDTLLHEMTHVEAWLTYAHRGHGLAWKRIATRVGCEARACSSRSLRKRRRGTPVHANVPDISWLPPHPQEGAA
jgi:hypothetical protein